MKKAREKSPLQLFFLSRAVGSASTTLNEKLAVMELGINKNQLEVFKQRAGLGYDELELLLPATKATLINRKNEEQFSQSVSESIIALADLYVFGYQVFEEEDAFNRWMKTELMALNGSRPLDYVGNQFGRELVRNLIGRIAYGVFS